jgi:probable rRNA maturation factor
MNHLPKVKIITHNYTKTVLKNRNLTILAQRVLSKKFKKKIIVIGITFVGEKRMVSLNQRFLDRPHLTDVLSFPHHFQFFRLHQEIFLGDIIICLPVAQKQANQNNISLKQEISQLFIHSLNHLIE